VPGRQYHAPRNLLNQNDLTGHRARQSKLTPADLFYAAKGPEARDLKAQLVFLSNEGEALRLKMFDLVPHPNDLDVLPHIEEDPK